MLVPSVRYLKAVADHGSFTRAAAALHVSQPALSQQIRELDERMGVQLGKNKRGDSEFRTATARYPLLYYSRRS